MNRRRFFGGLGSILAGGAALATAPPAGYPDRFEHQGVPIWWSGWRLPPNQDCVIGWWAARTPPDDRGHTLLVSPVTGAMQRSSDLYVLNLSYQKEWPILTALSTPGELEAVKQRAARALIEALDA